MFYNWHWAEMNCLLISENTTDGGVTLNSNLVPQHITFLALVSMHSSIHRFHVSHTVSERQTLQLERTTWLSSGVVFDTAAPHSLGMCESKRTLIINCTPWPAPVTCIVYATETWYQLITADRNYWLLLTTYRRFEFAKQTAVLYLWFLFHKSHNGIVKQGHAKKPVCCSENFACLQHSIALLYELRHKIQRKFKKV